MDSFSIIIYGYNEETSFGKTIKGAADVLSGISDHFEIIAVDDGSTDKTPEVLERLRGEYPYVKVLRHQRNKGSGAALRNGFASARYEWISFLPADGQIAPQDIKRLREAAQGVDVVTSVYLRRDDGFHRHLLSKGMRALLFLLFGPTPKLEGTYLFRKEVLDKIRLVSDTFVLNFEFVIRAKKAGFRFSQIETSALRREAGASKVANIRKILYVFGEVIRLRFKI